MTLTSVRLADSLQALIDSRLDTIERMLMGRVPRQDRLAIVKDVETQIFDILSEQATDEPTREDVLAALARLDPPEAYLPEEGETAGDVRVGMAPGAVAPRPVGAQPSRTMKHPKAGKISGILSLSMLGLSVFSPIAYLLGVLSGSVPFALFLWFGWLATIFGGSLVGLVLAVMAQFRGGWSIVGGILNSISLLYSVAAAILLVLTT